MQLFKLADPDVSSSNLYSHTHNSVKPGWNKNKNLYGDQSMSSQIAEKKSESLLLQSHVKGGYDHHSRDSALARVRCGGSVVPAKCRFVHKMSPIIPKVPHTTVPYDPTLTVSNALARVRGGGCTTGRCIR